MWKQAYETDTSSRKAGWGGDIPPGIAALMVELVRQGKDPQSLLEWLEVGLKASKMMASSFPPIQNGVGNGEVSTAEFEGQTELTLDGRRLIFGGTEVTIAPRVADVVKCLAGRKGEELSLSQLAEAIRGTTNNSFAPAVATARVAFKKLGLPESIVSTVRKARGSHSELAYVWSANVGLRIVE